MKYIVTIVEEIWVESEYSTIENVMCIESDLSLGELKKSIVEVAEYNDAHRDKKKFIGKIFTNKNPYDGYVNFENIITLDDWFESSKVVL